MPNSVPQCWLVSYAPYLLNGGRGPTAEGWAMSRQDHSYDSRSSRVASSAQSFRGSAVPPFLLG